MTQQLDFEDDLGFAPASTVDEAVARLFSLTASRDPGTRGPKRSLEALAGSLSLNVDMAATNATLGSQIAAELGVDWRPEHDFRELQITLDGLNSLLRGTTENLWRLSRRTWVDANSYTKVLLSYPAFKPATGKQEAVDRLSDLARVPRDTLGPGGKEHRITFEAVARRVAPDLLKPGRLPPTKHAIVEALCERLGVPWISRGASTGQTITKEGLNLLLAGFEAHSLVASAGWATPHEEGTDLVRVLRSGLIDHWDGRETVQGMRSNESRNWRQMEWAGFYFEEQVAALLNDAHPTPALGGPRRKYGATQFDYASPTRVWDAKAHTVLERVTPSGELANKASHAAILNDAEAIIDCVNEQGLGFIIIDGTSTVDATGEFDEWHRAYTRDGRLGAPYRPNTTNRRRRKVAFTPLALRALWIDDLASLDAGIAGGWISRQGQGAQQARSDETRGAARNDKFHLKVHKASPWVVAEEVW